MVVQGHLLGAPGGSPPAENTTAPPPRATTHAEPAMAYRHLRTISPSRLSKRGRHNVSKDPSHSQRGAPGLAHVGDIWTKEIYRIHFLVTRSAP